VIDHTPGLLRPGVELLVRTIDDSVDDRVPGLAAEVAFFALLSLPPLLLTAAASLGFLSDELTNQFVNGLTRAARTTFTGPTVDNIIRPTLDLLVAEERVDIISFSFAVTLFSVSRAIRVILQAVAIAYDQDHRRPSWRERLYSLLTTVVLLLVVPLVVPLLVAGPDLGNQLADLALVPAEVAVIWAVAYWPTVAVVTVLVVATTYHVATPSWTPWRRDLPGAALTVAIWLGGSAGLRLYTNRAISDPDVYGPLAGPLVLLVWLYLLAFAVLVGAELNAEIERLHPSPEQQLAPPSERLRRGARRARDRVRDAVPDTRPRRNGAPPDPAPAGRAGDD
jgi:membrane protein